MRWGVEVWDRFDDVSGFVHKGIDFCERYEEFLKKRCSIENAYAKSLRKLIESYEPKKKDTDENDSSIMRCFFKMLDELRDVAGQHELVAENVQEHVLGRLGQVIKSLKDERRKCIDEKERCLAEHVSCEELLDKCKQKYEKSYREVEKAEEQLNKVENDDSASKNDIKKQKSVCDQKKRQYDVLEAEYAKQLCEANRVKNAYYYQQLPAIFDDLQCIEKKRVENFKEFVISCVKIEVEVLPRIKQCLDEVESAACSINSDQDTELAVRLYKTGYAIPLDHVFEDLKQQNSSTTNSQNSGNGSLNGGLSGTSATLSVNSLGSAGGAVTAAAVGSNANNSRNKKYRTLNRIKGLFSVAAGVKSEQEALYDLPPQQLKNELLKKINSYQYEIEKYQKEREGLNKLKDIYSKNQKFGDSGSAEAALRLNDEKLMKCMKDLKRYQDLYAQVEQQYSASSSSSANSSEYSGSSSASASSHNHHHSQYQSPRSNASTAATAAAAATSTVTPAGYFKSSTTSSPYYHHSPSTPVSAHHHTRLHGASTNGDSNAVAYAVSPVSHLNAGTGAANGTNNNSTNKMAPLVNSNESFDEDDDDNDEEEDEEDYEEGGGYESPATALRSLPANLDTSKKTTKESAVAATAMKAVAPTIGFVYQASQASTTTTTVEAQYDQVDACLYDQPAAGSEAAAVAAEEAQIGTALAMYTFDGSVQNSIAIQESESLSVLEKDSGDGWTLVKRLNGEKGYVPTDYIQIVFY